MIADLHMDGLSESSRLLVNTATEDYSSPFQQKSVCFSCPLSKHLCLPSKAAILILLWTIVVGVVYHNLLGFSSLLVLSNPTPNAILSQYEPLPYAMLALVMMFYPLSGFIADVYCGRLKTVVTSLAFILSCWIIVLITLSLLVSISKPDMFSLQHNLGLVVIILFFISLFAFIIGLVGYQANFIQLGLDQLFEAPSQYLALFIHYATWAFNIGSLHYMINFIMVICFPYENKFALVITQALGLFFFGSFTDDKLLETSMVPQ